MSDTTYNGWSNWDTWNANLWLTSDEGTYKSIVRNISIDPNYLTERGPDGLPNGATLVGLVTSACGVENNDGIDLGEVDWQEITDAFLED